MIDMSDPSVFKALPTLLAMVTLALYWFPIRRWMNHWGHFVLARVVTRDRLLVEMR